MKEAKELNVNKNRISVKYQLAEGEFEEANTYIKTHFPKIYQGLATTGQMLMLFAKDELESEIAYSKDPEQFRKFGRAKLHDWTKEDRVVTVTSQVDPGMYIYMRRAFAQMYAPVWLNASNDETKLNNYLAEIGFLFLKRAENGEITFKLEPQKKTSKKPNVKIVK